MNDRIRKLFEESGMSKYALAQAAGVPYTTVSEILNEKIDINRCAAESVSRMAEVLGAKTEDVLNRYRVMEDAGGTYRGIRYRWQYNGECNEFYLKHKNIICGVLLIDSADGKLAQFVSHDGAHAPFLGNATLPLMKKWWEARAVPGAR